jgi:hypothetical protein
MADHCRKQIRDALVLGLAGMTTVNSIHTGRVHPIEEGDLPALLIFTNEEAVEDLNKAKDGKRTLTVTIEAHSQGDDVVDQLDAIAAEVEPLATGAAVPVWVKEVELTSTMVELSGDAVYPAGLIRLDFAYLYHANPAAPDTPLA